MKARCSGREWYSGTQHDVVKAPRPSTEDIEMGNMAEEITYRVVRCPICGGKDTECDECGLLGTVLVPQPAAGEESQ